MVLKNVTTPKEIENGTWLDKILAYLASLLLRPGFTSFRMTLSRCPRFASLRMKKSVNQHFLTGVLTYIKLRLQQL